MPVNKSTPCVIIGAREPGPMVIPEGAFVIVCDGGFAHLADEEADLLATEQAFYALVAMERQAQDLSSLYTMK